MSLPRFVLVAICIAYTAIVAGCPHGTPQPVEIYLSEDSCSICRMAVSDKKFAAEVVAPSGKVDYFDDIGCLVEFARAGSIPEGAGTYVVDLNTQEWLATHTANFIWAKDLPTPMSYGLGAFGTLDAANAALKQWPGKALNWDGLLAEFKP